MSAVAIHVEPGTGDRDNSEVKTVTTNDVVLEAGDTTDTTRSSDNVKPDTVTSNNVDPEAATASSDKDADLEAIFSTDITATSVEPACATLIATASNVVVKATATNNGVEPKITTAAETANNPTS